MRRVAFLSQWETPAATVARHRWMTPGRRGRWGDLVVEPSPWRADWVVVHQGLPGRRYRLVPPRRTVLLRHEPAAIAPHWPPPAPWPLRLVPPAYVQRFDVGDVPMAATWWLNLDYDALVALPPPPKPRALSAIASAKALVEGHRTRLAILAALAARHGDAIDIYGRGLGALLRGPAYKGPLERDTGPPLGRQCKLDGLRDYRYALCVENSRERNYYTEKIVDAWLAWAVPLYWGCPNLADYYPREAFVAIDLAAPDAADEIVRRSREPVSRLTLAAIAEARRLALDRYGIWGTVRHVLDRLSCPVPEVR